MNEPNITPGDMVRELVEDTAEAAIEARLRNVAKINTECDRALGLIDAPPDPLADAVEETLREHLTELGWGRRLISAASACEEALELCPYASIRTPEIRDKLMRIQLTLDLLQTLLPTHPNPKGT